MFFGPSKDNLGALRGILGKAIDASYSTQGIWCHRPVGLPWFNRLTMTHGGCIWFKDDEIH
jgi:hypothetical protein